MIVMSGKDLAEEIKSSLADELAGLDVSPKLTVIQVGDNAASSKYIAMKGKACEKVGILFEHIHLPRNTTEDSICRQIQKLNLDPQNTGIIVQLPLPTSLNTSNILEYISPAKDVDGLTTENAGKLLMGLDGLFPATAEGVINLLRYYSIDLKGKNVTVIGRSNLVGKPLALMLLAGGATVTVCHSKTTKLTTHTKQADIVISAVGKEGLVTKEMIKRGAVVIDVGMDVDFEGVSEVAEFLTPPTGAVGPMTVAMLLSNVVKAAKIQEEV